MVTEQQHTRIIQAERLKEENKNHKQTIRHLSPQIESMKPEPQSDTGSEPEAKEFDVEEALKNGAYVSGTTGSGKSDLAMYHAEAMMQIGVTVLVFDASQDWINRSSIPYYIPIEPNVHFQYELNHRSIIFDMGLLSPQQQKEIVKKICMDVWNHQVRNPERHWYYLIFEEAQLYFPQSCMRANPYATLVQLASEGRNYKIRFECITQFASMIDKDMKYMKQRYFGYTDEPNDTEYVSRFFPKSKQPNLILETGTFIYKHGNRIDTIKIEPYESQAKPKTLPRIETTEPLPQHVSKPVNPLQAITILLQILSFICFISAMLIAVSAI